MGLARRIIPTLLWSDHGCVKGRSWDKSRCIGSIADRIRLLERRDIDELIILDVSDRAPRYDEFSRIVEPLFCPITYGGGVRDIAGIRRLLAGGADKVALNSAARESPELINAASAKFGSQSIVVSIDIRRGGGSGCTYGGDCGRVVSWATECEQRGAGEILLTSMDRDGTMQGYDLDLITSVSGAVSIPVIAGGGCGSYSDMLAAFGAGAHAVAVGAAFQFRELTPKGAARYLAQHGIPTRV